jgi:hypothetical protein
MGEKKAGVVSPGKVSSVVDLGVMPLTILHLGGEQGAHGRVPREDSG